MLNDLVFVKDPASIASLVPIVKQAKEDSKMVIAYFTTRPEDETLWDIAELDENLRMYLALYDLNGRTEAELRHDLDAQLSKLDRMFSCGNGYLGTCPLNVLHLLEKDIVIQSYPASFRTSPSSRFAMLERFDRSGTCLTINDYKDLIRDWLSMSKNETLWKVCLGDTPNTVEIFIENEDDAWGFKEHLENLNCTPAAIRVRFFHMASPVQWTEAKERRNG